LKPPTDSRSLFELADSPPRLTELEAIGDYRRLAGLLGRRTAELHTALAAEKADAAFVPEPMSTSHLDRLRQGVGTQAQRSLELLKKRVDALPEAIQQDVRALLELGTSFDALLSEFVPSTPSGLCLRVHGDYHLGQVLTVDGDFVILDFEGEPTRSLAERREKQSPLKDVAGMIRSYHYAAYAGLFAHTHDRPDDFARFEPWAVAWYRGVASAFLHEYLTAARAAAFLPADRTGLSRLFEAFMLEKAFYELSYELNNRPDWVRIPLRGVLDLLVGQEATP
jgi:maltose alpha-D-glucosyltransferase/alpha-amylase